MSNYLLLGALALTTVGMALGTGDSCRFLANGLDPQNYLTCAVNLTDREDPKAFKNLLYLNFTKCSLQNDLPDFKKAQMEIFDELIQKIEDPLLKEKLKRARNRPKPFKGTPDEFKSVEDFLVNYFDSKEAEDELTMPRLWIATVTLFLNFLEFLIHYISPERTPRLLKKESEELIEQMRRLIRTYEEFDQMIREMRRRLLAAPDAPEVVIEVIEGIEHHLPNALIIPGRESRKNLKMTCSCCGICVGRGGKWRRWIPKGFNSPPRIS